VTFKVFGLPALTILFILSQIPFVGRATRLAQAAAESGPSSARPG
jgi:intracellular septation protein A